MIVFKWMNEFKWCVDEETYGAYFNTQDLFVDRETRHSPYSEWMKSVCWFFWLIFNWIIIDRLDKYFIPECWPLGLSDRPTRTGLSWGWQLQSVHWVLCWWIQSIYMRRMVIALCRSRWGWLEDLFRVWKLYSLYHAYVRSRLGTAIFSKPNICNGRVKLWTSALERAREVYV